MSNFGWARSVITGNAIHVVCLNDEDCRLLLKEVRLFSAKYYKKLGKYDKIIASGEATEKQVEKYHQIQEEITIIETLCSNLTNFVEISDDLPF